MQPRLTLVTLGVADVVRSRAFYEALGFAASSESKAEVVFIDAGGAILALWDRAALAEDAAVPDRPTGFGAVAVAWNTRSNAEVDAAMARAAAAGATITKPAVKTFWGGYAGYFADPDGHLWEVAYNPFWTMNAEGRIELPGTETETA